MTIATPEKNKEIYTGYHDKIIEKRFLSKSSIRQFAHRQQYQAFVDLIPVGATVLDSGCGEGVMCVMLAKKGCKVTGVDLSVPNIEAAFQYAKEQGIPEGDINFLVGDAEKLPVPDKSFDYVVSSHVLEHVPDFQKGVRELARVARIQAIAAIPTCLNPCAWVLLGNDKYWTFSRKSPYAIFIGLYRVILALLTRDEGVNEGYVGNEELIHIWRFPRSGKKRLENGGLHVIRYRGSSYIFPYFPVFLPISRFIQLFCWLPIIRNWGYGTTYICDPIIS